MKKAIKNITKLVEIVKSTSYAADCKLWGKGGKVRIYVQYGREQAGYISLDATDIKGRNSDEYKGIVYCATRPGHVGYLMNLITEIHELEDSENIEEEKPKSKSEIMKRAWAIAREGQKKFGGKVREYSVLIGSTEIAKKLKQQGEKQMKLVKKGIKPEEIVYRATCRGCRNVWETTQDKLKIRWGRDAFYVPAQVCSECGTYGLQFEKKGE